MMSYTKILKEKQRSPAITCHLTLPPYLRKGIFTNVYLDYLDKKKKKNQNTDVNITKSLCCFGVKYKIVFSNLLMGKYIREKKNGNKNKLGPMYFGLQREALLI